MFVKEMAIATINFLKRLDGMCKYLYDCVCVTENPIARISAVTNID